MRTLITLFLAVLMSAALAAPVVVEGVRLYSEPENPRLVLDLNGPPSYRVSTLEHPSRLVVDLDQASLRSPEFQADFSGGPVKGVRSAPRDDGLRVVLDLERLAAHRAYLLEPAGDLGHRLVVELGRGGSPAATSPAPAAAPKPVTVTPSPPQREPPLRDLLVAVDAGHGGRDPGALGPRGTREKDVVLAIARKLAAIIDREPGMRATMVRNRDTYIQLRDRIKLARERQADLFISIHADSYKDFGAFGSSVYVLSRDGASSEAARWLAESENAADHLGGVALEGKDQLVTSVLLDMSQTKTIEASAEVAGRVLGKLAGIGKLHSRKVQRAGFAVLKSPDIPSLLVETGFLSNPEEEAKLRDPAHQYRIAAAIFQGVRAYFADDAPAGTWIAAGKRPPAQTAAVASVATGSSARSHRISRGDTLYSIARRYRVEVDALRRVNGLRGNEIKVGQVLTIPTVSGV